MGRMKSECAGAALRTHGAGVVTICTGENRNNDKTLKASCPTRTKAVWCPTAAKEGKSESDAAAESVPQVGHAAFCAAAETGEGALLLGLAVDVLCDAEHAFAEAAQEQVAYWVSIG